MRGRVEKIEIRELCAEAWPAFEKLFGERGACGGCWCMAWRRRGREWEKHRGAENKRAMKALVTDGLADGVLAFAGGEPVGWCSVGPRADFPSLESKRSLATQWDERTWSITCFFVDKEWRRKGVAQKLLEGAVKLARSRGAHTIEGYPASSGGPHGKLPSAFAWTGLPQMFERAGFKKLAKTPGKRPILVKHTRKIQRSRT